MADLDATAVVLSEEAPPLTGGELMGRQQDPAAVGLDVEVPFPDVGARREEQLHATVAADRVVVGFGHGADVAIVDAKDGIKGRVVVEQFRLGWRPMLARPADDVVDVQGRRTIPWPLVPAGPQRRRVCRSVDAVSHGADLGSPRLSQRGGISRAEYHVRPLTSRRAVLL